MENYYEILGVSIYATDEELRTGFRKMSRKYHPDRNNDPDAHEKFIEINEAYNTLQVKVERDKYDKYLDSESIYTFEKWKENQRKTPRASSAPKTYSPSTRTERSGKRWLWLLLLLLLFVI